MATATELLSVIPSLPEKDRSFAADLASNVIRFGKASPKQQLWLDRLFEAATTPATSAPADKPQQKIDNMSAILSIFANASKKAEGRKGRPPALTLDIHGTKARLTIAGPGARFPGSINITSGDYGVDGRDWFGRIKTDGSFEPAQKAPKGLSALLTRFSADPLGIAAEHGRKTGYCCFCATKLTNKRSVELGYGPICESRWMSA